MTGPRTRTCDLRNRRRPLVEILEIRALLTSTPPGVFVTPDVGGGAGLIVQGPNNTLDFTGREDLQGRPTIEQLSANGPTGVIHVNVPFGTVIQGLAVGSDGNLWFVGLDPTDHLEVGKIARDGSTTPTTINVPVPFGVANMPSNADPVYHAGIAAGPDGNLWFTTGFESQKVGRITTAGAVTLFNAPPTGVTTGTYSITAGPDGNLWFVDGGTIGRITPSGVVTSFPVPSSTLPTSFAQISAIISGPGGALWFLGQNAVGRITTLGAVTTFPESIDGLADGLTEGPDGALWFTVVPTNFEGGYPTYDPYISTVGRLDPTTGAVTQVNLPAYATGIVGGPNRNLYAVGRDLSIIIPYATDTGVNNLKVATIDGGDYQVIDGIATFQTLLATFTAPSLSAPPAYDYTSPGNLIVADGGGKYSVYGTVPASAALVQVTVTETNGGASVTAGGAITGRPSTLGAAGNGGSVVLTNSEITVVQSQVVAGKDSVTVSAGAGSDSMIAGPLTGAIDWGDGSTPSSGLPISVGVGRNKFGQITGYEYAFQTSHGYPTTPGVYVTHASIVGPDGGRVDMTGIVVVNAPALTLLGFPPVTQDVPAPLNINIAQFKDANGITNVLGAVYTATIDWGDGSGPTAGTLFNSKQDYVGPHTYDVQGSHAYATPDTYRVKATIFLHGVPEASVETFVSVNFDPRLARFVNRAFTEIIGHPADPASLDNWTGQLAAGTVTPAGLATIYQSTPAALARRVGALFAQVGFSAPDPSTVAQVSQALAAGLSDESELAGLYGADLFDQQAGGTDSGFLRALYLKALGRPIDAQALAGYENLLANGRLTRTQVAARTLVSDEARARLVASDYATDIGRPATPTEIAQGLASLKGGTTDEQLVARLVGSTEGTS